MKSPSIGFSVGLALFLLLPFAVKLFMVEPYPAIILPSGSNKIHLSAGSITSYDLVITAHRRDGTDTLVDPLALITPAKKQYLHGIIQNELGCNIEQQERITSWKYLFDIQYKRKALTPESVAEAKRFFLERLGSQTDSLSIAHVVVKRGLNDGKVLERNVSRTTIVHFK